MFKKYLFLTLVLLGVTVSAFAEQAQPTYKKFVLENTQIVPMKSKAGRDYELIVSLPSSYYTQPEKKYPVLYYTDGYWDTPLFTSLYGNLIFDNQIPELIMVGLSYPAGTNYDVERRKDLTFSKAAGQEAVSGGAYAFLDFIKEQAAPFIETNFRGSPKDRVLTGNSLGGLFALTAAYKSNNFFSGYIAISPAVSWDNEALLKLEKEYWKNHKSLDARIFISYGSIEYPDFRIPIINFQKYLAEKKYPGLELQNYVMEGLDHTSVKGDGNIRGLMWVWKPKKPSGPSGLERGFITPK